MGKTDKTAGLANSPSARIQGLSETFYYIFGSTATTVTYIYGIKSILLFTILIVK
ncbi:MAG: hypothetical protein OIN89_07120 [Candidatus Methanoperedens sp.]|jgi:hypothetical protein|nr:hypothetical protein [Candidatus Methanoperedens sp.]